MVASIRTWNRLEPLARHKDLADGLEARLADPLWMLGRQWQFGEFKGSDGGMPVTARFEADRATLQRYRGGAADGGGEAIEYDPLLQPLEVCVESEGNPTDGDLRYWLQASAGLLRILKRRSVSRVTLTTLRTAYPVAEVRADEASERKALIDLAGRSAIDAAAYLADLDAANTLDTDVLPAALDALPPTEANKVRAGTLEWLGGLSRYAPGQSGAWQADRLEYAFAASAHLNGEVVLEASEYRGGRLDWYAFDARRNDSLGAARHAAQRVTRTALPVPVEYAGMPADRYWSYEDHPVRFGQIATSRTDLARLLIAEFALVYGDDWFVVPVELPLGSVLSNTTVTVVDSFGAEIGIRPERHPETTLFKLSPTDGDASDFFLLAPTLTDADVGVPLEQVMIVRDELANLVWGIEQRVPDGLGGSRDRSEEPQGLPGAITIDDVPEDAELLYRLNSTVPSHWIPYVPVRVAASTARRTMLERRSVESATAAGGRAKARPLGTILSESTRINAEEVTREGAIVERQKQLTRWIDGSYHLWVGRVKRVGRGEGSSGLRFDYTDRR